MFQNNHVLRISQNTEPLDILIYESHFYFDSSYKYP